MTCTRAVATSWIIVFSLFPSASAEMVSLFPTKDNSIFSDRPNNSSGKGYHLHTGASGGGDLRRAFVHFDVAAVVPSGSQVQSVELQMHVIDAANQGEDFSDVAVHRLLADWGEGLSNNTAPFGVGSGTGRGVAAEDGDVTWDERFYNSVPATPWTTSGGDFVSTASAVTTVGRPTDLVSDFYSWVSSPGNSLSDDVQLWLDSPAANFGWIVLGDETDTHTTRRFHSREFSDINFDEDFFWPELTVEYSTAAVGVSEPAAGYAAGWTVLLALAMGPVRSRHCARRRAMCLAE